MKKKVTRKTKATKYMTVALYREHERILKSMSKKYKMTQCEVIRYCIMELALKYKEYR